MKLQEIIGNENVKRAIEVSLSGNHKIVLIETINSQANELLEAAKQIAKENGLEFNGEVVSLCPCKAYTNPIHDCHCSLSEIETHIKKIAKTILSADIIAETTTPMESETIERNELDKSVIRRILSVDRSKCPKYNLMTDDALFLLNHALKNDVFDDDMSNTISKVANTISNMEGRGAIETPHLYEAIHYLPSYIIQMVKIYDGKEIA